MKQTNAVTPPERPGLTPDAIIETAIALADQHGVGAVTIRRVAANLGVTPMALYWHFTKKDDLLAGMVEWVFRQIDVPGDTGIGWEPRFRALMESELAVLRRHPELASLMISHESMSTAMLEAMELSLGLLREAGFTPTEAVQVIQHAQLSVINLALRQPGRSTERDPRLVEEQERQALASIVALPPDRYPHIIEAAAPLSRCEDPDRYYAFGLDMLMAGIRAMAESTRPL